MPWRHQPSSRRARRSGRCRCRRARAAAADRKFSSAGRGAITGTQPETSASDSSQRLGRSGSTDCLPFLLAARAQNARFCTLHGPCSVIPSVTCGRRKAMQRRLAAILAADVVGYSRLMGADEMGTITSLKLHRRELVDSGIAEHRGRIVKTTGDGMLVEFASVVDAVGCAVKIQRSMVRRNVGIPAEKQIVFRIGINVGDIIIDGDDIFGDGVNIAARLETLCEPGGVCISRAANDQIRDKLSLAFADLGEQAVKNISRAVGVFGLTAKDIEAIPDAAIPSSAEDTVAASTVRHKQEIHFCRTRDGVQLAYARMGQGHPLVKTGHWMTHIEFDFESPIWRHLYQELSREHDFVRYDARGNGLSDR